jgi:hypothetical protein
MAIPFRSWRPTKGEADLLVDMLTARLAPAKIAKTLYIDTKNKSWKPTLISRSKLIWHNRLLFVSAGNSGRSFLLRRIHNG